MENTEQTNNDNNRSDLFAIVGIGASAGGLEAMQMLLDNLAPDTGFAFIYIQHLDRDYESNLTDILSRHTKMMVLTVEHDMKVEPDHLYVLPPNKEVEIKDDILKLSERPPKPKLDLPINFFFLSIAENLRERAIGVILSGMASDGAVGLKAVKRAGGITFAQDDSAKFESMPRAAIAEDAVDEVLSPANIALELGRLSQNSLLHDTLLISDETVEEEENGKADLFKDGDLPNILQVLRNVSGMDFTHYKKNTIKRRIVRRMLLQKLNTLNEYLRYLKTHQNEVQHLYNDLLINVTHFFRDPDMADYLKNNILPKLLKNKSLNDPLRIWIPACSTGEEAYSMAIMVNEIRGDKLNNLPVQIFATDLSELAITKARTALYSVNEVQVISPERLQKYFVKVDGHFRVNKMIRDTCVFATHNLFKHPPFSRVDLISCCNVLIYLDNILQRKIISNFHYALNKNGYLVLGQSETVGTSGQYFAQVEKKLKIYVKKNDVTPKGMFEVNLELPAKETTLHRTPNKPSPVIASNNMNLDKMVDRVFLSEFSPAAVVVSYDLDIIQFRGSTSLFLEPSPGMASLNLLKMARSGLAFELRNGAAKVIKSGEPYHKAGIEINHSGQFYQVTIHITPLDLSTEEKLLLIVFEEVKLPVFFDKKGQYSKDRRVKQLENELLSLREDMRSIVEEQEAANEELQSANEEIVSSNEELQSINEELETSKEELESSNEELMTINQELVTRNDQLAEAHDYTAAVVSTIRESALILDSSLRVKIANAAFYRTFKTNEQETEGMLIYELANKDWNIPKLKELLEVTLLRNSIFHGLEIHHIFKTAGEKVLLVNGRMIIQTVSQQQLYLLVFEDITEHKHAEKLLEEREAWLRHMTDNVPIMLWVATPDKNFTYLNKTWLAFTGRTLAKETGIGWTEGVHKDDIKKILSTYHEAFNRRVPFSVEYRMKRYDGEYRWILNSAVPSYSSSKEFSGYIGSVVEIHDKMIVHDELERLIKERTEALQAVNVSLEKSNSELQQFAYVASHDLQEPLRKIITFSNRLREKHPELLTEGSKEYLDKIRIASQRMTHLIDALLDFSRATISGKSIVSTDLNKVIKNVLTDLELVIQETNAKININRLPDIEAVPLQMNQLFFNLVGNALKFTKVDIPPKININCRVLTPEEIRERPLLNVSSKYFEIIVQDEGIGFPQEFAEQIFVIFQRLNERQQFSGTGIGLALCKKIVENHKGEIFAKSEEGIGASFYVILPEKQGF